VCAYFDIALRWVSTMIRVLAEGNACCAGIIVGSMNEESKGASKAGYLEDGVGRWMLDRGRPLVDQENKIILTCADARCICGRRACALVVHASPMIRQLSNIKNRYQSIEFSGQEMTLILRCRTRRRLSGRMR
jgi:hypothetical protein